MILMKDKINAIFNEWLKENDDFSGVFSVSSCDEILYQQGFGFRNRAEKLPNTPETRFAIASGTKLFTGLSVCKLIQDGKLALQTKLGDVLKVDLGQINPNITILQLLTHTSGVGDYVDEENEDMDQMMADLYAKYPAQNWTNMDYYLQMITPLAPKFPPGERYAYSNSGYVLLGLVIEAVSGIKFQDFVKNHIIEPSGLTHTGFYKLNALPENTALGYVSETETNIFGVPVIGGADGGIFSCATDWDKLWRAIFSNKILSKEMTDIFLNSHVEIDDEETYGLGVYKINLDGKIAHFAVGGDTGVGFFTAYCHANGLVASGFSNTKWINDTYDLIAEIATL